MIGGWFKRSPPEAMGKWLEIAKTLAEIVAIVVAGSWAYTRYFAGEAPSLEERGVIESTLEWTSVEEQRCTAAFGITIKNIGKRSFDVKQIKIAASLVPSPPRTSGIVRLQPLLEANANLYLENKVSSGSLILHYPPDVSAHDDYVFSVPRDSLGEPQLALFTFESVAITADGTPLRISLDDYRWSANCDQPIGAVSPKSTPTAEVIGPRRGGAPPN
jgi:hypothetical protein